MKNLIALLCILVTPAALAEEKKIGFDTEAQAGLVLTSGNTETTTISLKDESKYTWEKDRVLGLASFLTSSNRGVEQAYQWNLGARYERELNDAFSVFLGELIQSDRYQKILQRYSTDVGGKYTFQKSENITWFLELGYRFTRENYTYGQAQNLNFMRVFHQIEKSWNKNVSGKWWVEYLPNLTVWKGYQFNTEASISTVLTDVFSLKTAYLIRYYNEPPAGVAQKADTTFTTALVAKF